MHHMRRMTIELWVPEDLSIHDLYKHAHALAEEIVSPLLETATLTDAEWREVLDEVSVVPAAGRQPDVAEAFGRIEGQRWAAMARTHPEIGLPGMKTAYVDPEPPHLTAIADCDDKARAEDFGVPAWTVNDTVTSAAREACAAYDAAYRTALGEAIKGAWRVVMRAPRAGERGWWVTSRNEYDALVEVRRECDDILEPGWPALTDYDPAPDKDNMIPVTVVWAPW